MYTYLAGHVGHTGDQGAFRALARGYTHWASGRLEEIQVKTNHPEFCHVRCTMKPSMRSSTYHVYLLLGREGELATICSATCEFAAGYVHVNLSYTKTPHGHSGTHLLSFPFSLPLHVHIYIENRKSASCTHVSAVLHALAGLNPTTFQLKPNLPPAPGDSDDDEPPVTSLPCQ